MFILGQEQMSDASTWQSVGYVIGGLIFALTGGTGGFFLQRRLNKNGRTAQPSDVMAPMWCDKRHEDLEERIAHDRKEFEKRLDERHKNQSESLQRIEAGVSTIHGRIDTLFRTKS